jgi:hypothetical protein
MLINKLYCQVTSEVFSFIFNSGFLHIGGNSKNDIAQNGPILSVHEIVLL